MKFSIDVECTAEEARHFLGLPDVREFQQAMMETVRERMAEQLKTMDPEALMKTWLPAGAQAWESMQQAFMRGFAGQGGGGKSE